MKLNKLYEQKCKELWKGVMLKCCKSFIRDNYKFNKNEYYEFAWDKSENGITVFTNTRRFVCLTYAEMDEYFKYFGDEKYND